MATYTLTGDIGDLVGGDVAFPNGRAPLAWLAPASQAAIESGEVRLGGVPVDVAADGTFSTPGIPPGDYTLVVTHYDTELRRPTTWTSPSIEVAADTTLAV